MAGAFGIASFKDWSARRLRNLCLAGAVFLAGAPASDAHPHVFVDGGIDFRFRDGTVLDALEVTWRYDKFETLYILSSHGISLNADGELDEADRLELVRLRSNWPEDFDGSAHVTIKGEPVPLEWPEDLDLNLVDGRLEATFTRRVATPIDLAGRQADVAFYESTYFFAFSLTDVPVLVGMFGGCAAQVIPHDETAEDEELRAALAKLGREETPDVENVGALFADRIVLACD